MKQRPDIQDLLSRFFSEDLSAEEKSALYVYLNDDMHKDEVINFLKQQWDITSYTSQDNDKPGNFVLERIKKEIDEKLRPEKKSLQNSKMIWTFMRYAAIFIVAFGASWILQRVVSNKSNVPVISENKYNEILVPYGSKTMVVLPDSSKVWLNSGSRLRYTAQFSGTTREVFLQGEGFFDVAKDPQRPFFVKSNGMNIKVIGTKFNLMAHADDNMIVATLIEGAIEVLGVKNEDQENIVLTPGQKLTLHKEQGDYQVGNIREAGLLVPQQNIMPVRITSTDLSVKSDNDYETAWKDSRLVFTKERFEDVKTKLERWYGVTIEVKEYEILDYRFTGAFDKETVEQAMLALERAVSCKFTINKDIITVSKK